MYTVIAVFNSLSVLGRSRYAADFAAPALNRCIYCLLKKRIQQGKHDPQLKEPQ
jgi:hypothetical protein